MTQPAAPAARTPLHASTGPDEAATLLCGGAAAPGARVELLDEANPLDALVALDDAHLGTPAGACPVCRARLAALAFPVLR